MNHSYEDQGKNAIDAFEYQGISYLEKLKKKIPKVEGIEKGIEIKE